MKFSIFQKTILIFVTFTLFFHCKTEEKVTPKNPVINDMQIKMVGYCSPCYPNEINDTVWVEYSYDNENRLLLQKELNGENIVNNIPDEVTYEYDGDQIVRVNNFYFEVTEKASTYNTYKYNASGQLSEERYYFYNVPNEYSNFGKLIYEYDNGRLKRSEYILDGDDEVDYYTEYDWSGNNLREFKVISILHDGEEKLYYSQSFEYDKYNNPYCLIKNNPTIPLSENNQIKMEAVDGGWYHGDYGFEKMIEYNDLELPIKISREYYDHDLEINFDAVVFYKYEEL